MIGRIVGYSVASVRDFIARGLVRFGVTPNMLTLAGMVLTAAAGVCYAIGAGRSFALSLNPSAAANAYLLLAGVLLFLASACDMLDGAVARLGGKGTRFGAFLDSTLDRYSDFAVYVGIAFYYAWQEPANLTFVLLCMLAFFNAFMISYTRARAEDLIGQCKVGYWQRGERSVSIMLGTFFYHVPALVLQQSLLPMMTVARRIGYTKHVLAGRNPTIDPRQGGWWLKVRVWRWPRMTVPYDVITFLNGAFVVLVRIEPVDVIRKWLGL